MKKLSYVVSALFGVVIAASFFVSCSEDSGDNVSVPRFSGIEFSRETLYAGETVNATAVQYKKGKRLIAQLIFGVARVLKLKSVAVNPVSFMIATKAILRAK